MGLPASLDPILAMNQNKWSVTYVARSKYHTKLAKMSFEEKNDLTASFIRISFYESTAAVVALAP